VLDAANASPYNVSVNASYVIVRGLTLKQDAIRISPTVKDVVIEDNDISGWGRARDGTLVRTWTRGFTPCARPRASST